jgi:hypothetical protein
MTAPREVSNVFSKRVAIFTLIFNFLLVIFSGLLWKVSRDANDTNVATQRASISSSGPAIAKIANTDGKTLKGVTFFYSLVNSGTTPARTAVAESNVRLGRATPQRGVNFDDLPQAERLSFVLGPKGLMQLAPIFSLYRLRI